MKTWSAEELFIRAYAAGAVAAQGVWDLVKGVERITKPPRRTGFDEDAAGEYLACSPNGYYGFEEPNLGPVPRLLADDPALGLSKPGLPCACCFERERTEDSCLCDYCTERGVDPSYYSRHEIADETPNPTEPGLDDDELIGVRGLLQERYGDQSERADTQDAQMWRAYVDGDEERPCIMVNPSAGHLATCSQPHKTSPAASAAGVSPSDACDIPPSPSEGRPTSELLIDGANAIELWCAGSKPPKPGIRGDWERLVVEMHHRATTFADIEQSK